jgi:hypothetical protein
MRASSSPSFRQSAAAAIAKARTAAPFAERERRSSERDENAGVDRVADPAIGAIDDEFVAVLQRDVAAPVAAEQDPRPDRERDPRKASAQARATATKS